MEFNLFIIPITIIIVQLLKQAEVPSKWLPLIAVTLGAIGGLAYAMYYNTDLFVAVVNGFVFGASASGIYDLAKTTIGGN